MISPESGLPSAVRTSTGNRFCVRAFIRYGNTGWARSSSPRPRGTRIVMTAPAPTAWRGTRGDLFGPVHKHVEDVPIAAIGHALHVRGDGPGFRHAGGRPADVEQFAQLAVAHAFGEDVQHLARVVHAFITVPRVQQQRDGCERFA